MLLINKTTDCNKAFERCNPTKSPPLFGVFSNSYLKLFRILNGSRSKDVLSIEVIKKSQAAQVSDSFAMPLNIN